MIPSFARPCPSLIALACLLSALSPSRAASLVVNTTLLQRSGDAVLVTWSDLQPSPSDNITVTANNLTILQMSATACPTWQQGRGSLAVRLVDIYAPLTISYTTPLGILAASPPITFSDPNQPLFPRLSLLGDPANTLVLTWTAAQFTSNERVLLRPAGCSTCNFTTFSLLPDGKGAVTYSVKDMCGGVAKTTGWFEPGWQLSAALPGLDASSDYDYLFGTPDSMSQVTRLSTPPAAASAASKVTVYLFGDMGVAAAPPQRLPSQPEHRAINSRCCSQRHRWRILHGYAYWRRQLRNGLPILLAAVPRPNPAPRLAQSVSAKHRYTQPAPTATRPLLPSPHKPPSPSLLPQATMSCAGRVLATARRGLIMGLIAGGSAACRF